MPREQKWRHFVSKKRLIWSDFHQPRRGLPELLGRPGVGRAAGHIEMNDFPRAVHYEEEREDGTKQHVVELQEVARPDVTIVINMGKPPATATPGGLA